MTAPTAPEDLDQRLEEFRSELRGYCYRMLASPFDADDAAQETLIRAWKSYGDFEQRASLRSWLYRIATNVCIDMQRSSQRRARPMDLGPSGEPIAENLHVRDETTWLEPAPDTVLRTAPAPDPAEAAVAQDSVRLAFVAALQHLPPKQRASLILCEVLQWKAAEVAELLDTTTASINSALQRARATLEQHKEHEAGTPVTQLSDADRELLVRYVKAFEAYDIDALTTLIHEDATQSMPPFDLWLSGRDDIFTWWLGPGIGCKGSRVIPTVSANGSPAFGQYKPSENGGYEPWALQVLELRDGGIGELTFFLSTEKLFPLFGLPLHLDG
jgi:RNA polymerase sigma-70 factor (ECF subfamily)